MSDELADEVEAINAIYGPGHLEPVTGTTAVVADAARDYVLRLRVGTLAAVRLRFPASYPDAAPSVQAPHRAPGRRGDVARDAAAFARALAAAWRPGQVCVFDALEDFARVYPDPLPAPAPSLEEREEENEKEGAKTNEAEADDADDGEDWAVSDPVTELGSIFVGRARRARTAGEAAGRISRLLDTDRRARAATHNISAWRLGWAGGAAGTGGRDAHQDYDDDGEQAAGARLLTLLRAADVRDVVVVVSRWYGGRKLGPRRFAMINAVARQALVRGGFIV